MVLVEEGDPVAGSQPGRDLGHGGSADPFDPLRPGPGAAFVTQSLLVGSLGREAAERISHTVDGHDQSSHWNRMVRPVRRAGYPRARKSCHAPAKAILTSVIGFVTRSPSSTSKTTCRSK